jgi:hypothetical protein
LELIWTLWSKENSLGPTEYQTSAFQPVARRYTGVSIPILFCLFFKDICPHIFDLILSVFNDLLLNGVPQGTQCIRVNQWKSYPWKQKLNKITIAFCS